MTVFVLMLALVIGQQAPDTSPAAAAGDAATAAMGQTPVYFTDEELREARKAAADPASVDECPYLREATQRLRRALSRNEDGDGDVARALQLVEAMARRACERPGA